MAHLNKETDATLATTSSRGSYHGHVCEPRKFANPGPLGLFSFASTTLILSLFNLHARDITVPNIVVGQAVAVGGLGQILAGIGDFLVGNTFGATAFTLFGGFWLAYALIQIPDSGILAAYAASPEKMEMRHNALAIWLITWFVITFILWIASFRANLAINMVFFNLFVTFIILAAGDFTENVTVTKAGGAMGCLTAFTAFYAGAAQLYTPEATYVRLPVLDLPKHQA